MYILDANIFIQAARTYYAIDLVPGFWNTLVTHGKSGKIATIDHIEAEILRGNDPLAVWIKNDFTFIMPTNNAAVAAEYSQMVNWVQSNAHYTDAAKAEFASVADGWLIAYAKLNNLVLVTHEQPDKKSKRRVLIPDVCEQFGVDYINTFDLLRALKAQYN
jgi:hypothetical protein